MTGGYGALGLAAAAKLVSHGARSIVLVGRSGAKASHAKAIAAMIRVEAEVPIES
ncbi:MAG: KR domain-containing protein [Flavobacteriales bacterium]